MRYEYTPGFEELDALSVGAQGHYWFGERVKLGLTANSNDEGDVASGLEAADVTVRISSDSWFKLQGAQTEGFLSNVMRSDDGGFGFSGYADAAFLNADAGGYRADVSLGPRRFLGTAKAALTMYTQSLDGGYAAPGLQTLTDTEHYGATFQMPVTERVSLRAKSDHREAALGSVRERARDRRRVSVERQLGCEHRRACRRAPRRLTRRAADARSRARAPTPSCRSATTRSAAGARTASCRTRSTIDGTREENGRIGTGGSYRISERLKVDAEVSDGDLGTGGKIGTNYLHNDRTTLYLNYALENERTDNGLLATRGSEGNTVAGVKTRLVRQHERLSWRSATATATSRRASRTRRASAWRRRSA